MKKIHIQERKLFNPLNDEIITLKEQDIQLEHSLVSISKWEQKWHKPFFSKDEKTTEETIDYFRCMTLTQNVDPNIYYCLTNKNVEDIKITLILQ